MENKVTKAGITDGQPGLADDPVSTKLGPKSFAVHDQYP